VVCGGLCEITVKQRCHVVLVVINLSAALLKRVFKSVFVADEITCKRDAERAFELK